LRKPLINNRIRASEVRVIDADGKNLGVISLQEALRKARERNLDLVQVTEKIDTPVCKITDYGKYLYQKERKERKSRPRGGDLKGIRLGFNISPHDLQTRVRQAKKFLTRGDKIRVEVILRGRERALTNVARDKIRQFLEMLEKEIPIKVERELQSRGRRLIMIIVRK